MGSFCQNCAAPFRGLPLALNDGIKLQLGLAEMKIVTMVDFDPLKLLQFLASFCQNMGPNSLR
jgi:hypothetical protein